MQPFFLLSPERFFAADRLSCLSNGGMGEYHCVNDTLLRV